jgi:hypothetical protein
LAAAEVAAFLDGGQRVAMRESGVRYFFVNDHLGSPVTVLNDSGGVVSQLKYYAYGRLRNVTPSGSEKTDKLFTPPKAGEAATSLRSPGRRSSTT